MQQNQPPQPSEQPAESRQSQAPSSASPPLPANSRSTRRVALRYGLLFGLIIVVREALGAFIATAFNLAFPQLAASYSLPVNYLVQVTAFTTTLYTLIDWVIFFFAGFFAARRAPQIRVAIFTSLWVDLCYGLVYCLVTGISLFIFSLSLSQYRGISMNMYVSETVTQAGITLLLLHIVLGTAIGTLGGWAGARSVSDRNTTI